MMIDREDYVIHLIFIRYLRLMGKGRHSSLVRRVTDYRPPSSPLVDLRQSSAVLGTSQFLGAQALNQLIY
ncbi:unnamed protein product [Danaus chrysippus]|uniref:(African queen) hypothetical protein n=1 Tax=Danaus chrysippus TaxID=151541 RepID=A0A8J2MLM9_9NEOP|nr:unnamed protein product [Danaus chrysippus]